MKAIGRDGLIDAVMWAIPRMEKEVEALEQKIEELENKLKGTGELNA